MKRIKFDLLSTMFWMTVRNTTLQRTKGNHTTYPFTISYQVPNCSLRVLPPLPSPKPTDLFTKSTKSTHPPPPLIHHTHPRPHARNRPPPPTLPIPSLLRRRLVTYHIRSRRQPLSLCLTFKIIINPSNGPSTVDVPKAGLWSFVKAEQVVASVDVKGMSATFLGLSLVEQLLLQRVEKWVVVGDDIRVARDQEDQTLPPCDVVLSGRGYSRNSTSVCLIGVVDLQLPQNAREAGCPSTSSSHIQPGFHSHEEKRYRRPTPSIIWRTEFYRISLSAFNCREALPIGPLFHHDCKRSISLRTKQ